MATSYNFLSAGELVENAPIDPRSQNFFAMKKGLFCNNGCGCEGELVDYTVSLTLDEGVGITARFLVGFQFTLEGVEQTIAYDGAPLDLTLPVNTALFLEWLQGVFGQYLIDGGGVAVTPTIAAGLVTDLVVTVTAQETFIPVKITFLNGENADASGTFTVVP